MWMCEVKLLMSCDDVVKQDVKRVVVKFGCGPRGALTHRSFRVGCEKVW